jgi:hypothetical protein
MSRILFRSFLGEEYVTSVLHEDETRRKRNKTDRQKNIKIIRKAVRDKNNNEQIFGIEENNRTVFTYFMF